MNVTERLAMSEAKRLLHNLLDGRVFDIFTSVVVVHAVYPKYITNAETILYISLFGTKEIATNDSSRQIIA